MSNNSWIRSARAVAACACAVFLCACSGSDGPHPEPGCAAEACGADARVADVSAVAVVDSAAVVAPDAGFDPWTFFADAGASGGPLELNLSITGAKRSCGDCAVVTANVSGGRTPYRYEWSDSKLSGPGPHELCDKQSSTYQVKVSDSSLASPDDPTPSAMNKTATAELPCSEAKPTDTSELSGCKLLIDASFLSILNPKGVYVERVYGCPDTNGGPGVSASIITDPDAGPQPVYAAQGFDIPEGMKAGKSYQLSFDLLFPVTIGGDVRMELWASHDGCSLDERLAEIKWEGIDHQSWCLTPPRDTKKLLIRTADNVEAPFFSVSFGVSATLCSECAKP